MSTEVKVPALGESLTSGILAKWHAADGASVSAGQSLYELETDKITSEATAEVAGVLRHRAAEGEEVKIGQVVAVIEEGASAPAKAASESGQAKEDGSKAKDAKGDQAGSKAAPAKDEKPTAKDDDRGAKDEKTPAEDDQAPAKPAKPLSPAPRRIVAETGIDPTSVTGTGKDGRVTKGDLLAAQKEKAAPAPAASSAPTAKAEPASATDHPPRESRTKLSPLRARIASRLVEAQAQAALLTTFNEVDMAPLMELRKRHQEAFTARHGVKLGFMSFFAKAVVSALQAVPALNARLDGDSIVQNHFYDIGVAVSTERGLMVPVVRKVDQLSFAGIEKEIGRYAKLARDNKIQLGDLQGGVFTITNGGIFGSLLSTPIVNPPQSGILGMHSTKDRPVVVNGEIVIRPMMYLALTYDHRIVDGREAVTFLVKVKDAIEDPSRLLFDL